MSLLQGTTCHKYNVCYTIIRVCLIPKYTYRGCEYIYILVYCLSTMCLMLNIVTYIHKHSVCDVTAGMQNCSVYTKSNWDEANFPCIGSITTPRSTSYRTSGLTPFRNLQILPQTTVSSIEDHQFQQSSLRNVPCTPYHLGMRMIPCLRLKW